MSCAESTLPLANTLPREDLDSYVTWLRNSDVPIFEIGGAWWRPYQRALVPAGLNPRPIQLSKSEEREALQKSGCLFLRYFTRRFDHPTEFWYVACIQYDFDKLSANTRSKLRRGQKRCAVRQIDGEWLATHGYSCYLAAHTRYQGALVLSEAEFEENERRCIGGPFDSWGVFIEDQLVGYARCVVGEDYVATLVLKFHPDYLKSYSAYALMDAILGKYVRDEHKLATNGFRSLVHDTNMQQFLEQFAFQKIYCDLKMVYRPSIGFIIRLLYPFMASLDRVLNFPGLSEVKHLLAQERVHRSFKVGKVIRKESVVNLLGKQA